ncbi:MAG: hypothetical protein ABI873_01880 [Marmoricola sp.]
MTRPEPTHRGAQRPRESLSWADYEQRGPLAAGTWFKDNGRMAILLVLFSFTAVVGGFQLLTGSGGWHRVLGVVLLLLTALFLTSFVLRFTPPLTGARWTASRPRRLARFVLRFAWWVPTAVVFSAAAWGAADWLVQRLG